MEIRQYFWSALLVAIILVSLVIVIIFIFINICLSKRASWSSTKAKPNHYGGSNVKQVANQVHHKDPGNEKPPLPSRDQFLTVNSVDQSYEDLSTAPDYIVVEGSTPPLSPQPSIIPEYIPETKSQDEDSEDYDDIDMPDDCDSEDYDDIG